MKKITIIATLLALATGGILFSNHAAASAGKRPAGLQTLARLQGTWQGPISLEAGGQTMRGSLSMQCRSASAGSAVLCETEISLGGGAQKETDVFGYDAATGSYHWFVVCSGGEAHDHVATKLKGGEAEWLYEEQHDGGKFVERVAMAIVADGAKIEMKNTMSLAGKITAEMSGTIEKMSAR